MRFATDGDVDVVEREHVRLDALIASASCCESASLLLHGGSPGSLGWFARNSSRLPQGGRSKLNAVPVLRLERIAR